MLSFPKKQIGVGDVDIPKITKTYIADILKSRRITYGKYIKAFEKEVAKAHEVKYAIFCNSGTSALQVALHSLKKEYKWKDGDEVIVPALTFVATVNVVLQNGLTPVFVDVEPEYFMLDSALVEKAITKRTRAIIPVHIGGQPADMEPIMRMANKHRLKVIEDSCETMFATYQGKPVGSFGDFSCFSTYAAHTLVTGVGGFICTNNPKLAIRAKSLVNHGRDGIYITMDDDKVQTDDKLWQIVDRRFNFIDIGYSYRATEFEGALGLAQMHNWKKTIAKRKKNALYLTNGLKSLEKYLQLPRIRPRSEHAFMFYPIVITHKSINRTDLIHFLEKRMIETRYLLPLLCQPIYKELWGDIEKNYPVSKMLGAEGFYVGSHPGLTKKELDYIIKTFHEFFAEKK